MARVTDEKTTSFLDENGEPDFGMFVLLMRPETTVSTAREMALTDASMALPQTLRDLNSRKSVSVNSNETLTWFAKVTSANLSAPSTVA